MMIQSHLYVKRSNSPLYPSPEGHERPAMFLDRGHWVGVLETLGDWVKVTGVYFIGWMKVDALEPRPPFDLHIHQRNPNTIQYVNSTE
jgi:hypothetical protein